MKILGNNGQLLNAEIIIDDSELENSWDVIVKASWGTGANALNPDYFEALKTLLERVKEAGGRIERVMVESREAMRDFEDPERKLDLEYPIHLSEFADMETLRLMITGQAKKTASKAQSKNSGNPTKKIRITFSPKNWENKEGLIKIFPVMSSPWLQESKLTSRTLTKTDVPTSLGGSTANQAATYINISQLIENSGAKAVKGEPDRWSESCFFPEIDLNDQSGKQSVKIIVKAPQINNEVFNLKWHLYAGKPRNPRVNGWEDNTWNPFLKRLNASVGDTLHFCGDWNDPESAKIYLEKSSSKLLDEKLGFRPGTVEKFLRDSEVINDEAIEIPELALKKNLELDFYERVVEVKYRREQKLLRKSLGLDDEGPHYCDLCGNDFPAKFLVAAHIKPRKKCSEEEKGDLNVVMRACLAGCDHLYELGLISVNEGFIIVSPLAAEFNRLNEITQSINSRAVTACHKENAIYFLWHYENIYQT
tara:strand:+ start:425 stop:1861 length:1437 start_codon:yes stop_codon:yes gene_type:complete